MKPLKLAGNLERVALQREGFHSNSAQDSLDLRGLGIHPRTLDLDDDLPLDHDRRSEHRSAFVLREQLRFSSERLAIYFRHDRNDLAVGGHAVTDLNHETVPGLELANRHRFHAATRMNPERFRLFAPH